MGELKREVDQEIREKAYIIVEELIQLYKMTNPKFGSKSEDDKLENARISISLFWELFDLLGYWAQCQIIAYKRSAVDSEFTSSMIEETKDLPPIPMHLRRLGTRYCKPWRIIFPIPILIILSPKQVICPTKDDIRNYCDFFYSKCSRPNRLKATLGDSHFKRP
jgi:hypothetical protein